MVKVKDIKAREPSDNLRGRRQQVPGSSPINILTEDFYEQIRKIEIDKLLSFKNQARRHFDQESINKLAKTIKEHGVRQPLTVIESATIPGVFEIVSGERRVRAAKEAGLSRVPCIIIHDRKKAEEIALIENVQREDLHPVELGRAYLQLIENGICSTQEEVAEKVGVQKSQVSEYIKYAKLPETIKSKITEHKLTRRAFLRNILRTYSVSKMSELIEAEIYRSDPSHPKRPSDKPYAKTLLTIYEYNGEIKVNASGYHDSNMQEKAEIKEILEELLKTQ